VAERIWRSYCPVNWGVLNWQWKQASTNSHILVEDKNASGTANQSRLRPSFRPLSKVGSANGRANNGNCSRHPNPNHASTDNRNGAAVLNGQPHTNANYKSNNSAKQPQRGGSSLISYYP
jgi:hypothetical protein